QVKPGAAPAFELHASITAGEADLAKFVVANGRVKVWRKFNPQLLQTFTGAFKCRVVADAHIVCIACVVAVGHNEVRRAGAVYELVEQMALAQGIAQPKEAAVSFDEKTLKR